MPEPTFSPGDPFGGQPPWLGIPSKAALERLNAVLASDWELQPDLWAAFQAEISQALRICADADHTLVLRDHSHSDFCRSSEPQRDVLLLSWLKPHHRFRSLRHPLDSWLALVHAGWHTQFQPSTLLEYCRRQQAFLDATDAMPQLHYEDFCTAPLSGLEQICDALLLPFDPTALDRFGSIHLSGDSGRRNTERIEPRPRRAIPESIQAELSQRGTQRALSDLCERMHYRWQL